LLCLVSATCANATTAMIAKIARTKTVRIMMFLRKLCV
jgi:hypothetical protein